MFRRHLLWKVYFTYSLVIVFCLALVGGFLVQRERRIGRDQAQADLALLARVLDERLGTVMTGGDAAGADSLVKRIGREIATRITVVAADGRVFADSDVDPRRMENHRFRAEIESALGGAVGQDVRTSASDFASHLYVAVPSASRPGWVMRVAIPLQTYEKRLQQSTKILVVGAIVAAMLSMLLGFVFTRRITRPLENMSRGLERMERGEFGVRLDPESDDEIGQLARTLNRVQERLEDMIGRLTTQRNEREAILASMVEGVIAVDDRDRVLLVNAAAQRVLGVGADAVNGRPLVEVARFPQLNQFIEQVRNSHQPLGVELVVRDPRPRYLELHGAPLRVRPDGPAGAVVVFNDVTRLRKLEEVRREFVANVSHELKTPITSIKGFLETLLDGGALEDPEAARRFLGIVARQSDRLAAIIEDLLYLSRLEYEERQIDLHPVDLRAVIERSVANFEHEAQARDIRVAVEIEARHHWAMGDASLLSRALENLIDNAIKYSHRGGRVEVTLREAGDELHLAVRDHGIGIADEHLTRVSERFYRVDTARSREMGGTGLGLAIVKHVARVHAGSLHIQSDYGRGSSFTIRLPKPAVNVWPPARAAS